MLATLTFIFGCDIDSYKDYTVREYSANTISSGENDHGTFLRFFEVLGNNPIFGDIPLCTDNCMFSDVSYLLEDSRTF